MCEQAPPNIPVPVVGDVAVTALALVPNPPADLVAKAAAWLQQAAAKADPATRAILLQQLASVRNFQGDYDASMALYRQAIEANGKDALAMNNLAYMLSVRHNKHDEALELLDRAKKAIGPNPHLLDTEATVRLNKGEVDAARGLLEVVVAEDPSAAGYFHLAQVEVTAKRDVEARLAWRRAGELRIQRADLHPLERDAFDQLAIKLN